MGRRCENKKNGGKNGEKNQIAIQQPIPISSAPHEAEPFISLNILIQSQQKYNVQNINQRSKCAPCFNF